jgi:hypothetical protein
MRAYYKEQPVNDVSKKNHCYSGNHTVHINTSCGQNAVHFSAKVDGKKGKAIPATGRGGP